MPYFEIITNLQFLTKDLINFTELQKISRDDGKETGQDVAKLRKILEVFPRYQNSLIIGPDVTNFESRENILFLRNYLLHAQNSLNVFTIHP